MGSYTDSVHVHLPMVNDEKAARSVLVLFGEIASIEPLREVACVFAVTYFDVRAAVACLDALAPTNCWPSADSGARTARLPGSVTLEQHILPKIANIKMAQDKASYVVEFFDSRDAARYKKTVAEVQKAKEKEEKPQKTKAAQSFSQASFGSTPAPSSTTSGSSAAPSAASTTTSSASSSTKAASGNKSDSSKDVRAQNYDCIIKGLPNRVLSDAMMEAMLEQAGVDNCVVKFATQHGTPNGTAVITLSQRNSAERCARHFEGCKWGAAAGPVVARIVISGKEQDEDGDETLTYSKDDVLLMQMEAREDAEGGFDKVNEETFGAGAGSWSFEEQVAANQNLKSVGTGKLCGRSDASTDASESDEECRRVQRCA
eukprot:TRINITY_DN113732_c0_g1_i1.p1 TRINITY_DN113732_c0_g1~~TRINITY_DN113732_c0_g1_i1.p1  ORF type:complete len:412 (+),score=83.92 TRINITY_DN113732_c0_g1_i1:118-1236(+)